MKSQTVSISDYDSFIAQKLKTVPPVGFDVALEDLDPVLFPFQKHITRWSLRRGRAAVFAGCGLGKTIVQCEWSRHVHEREGVNIIIFAPLAVAEQTVKEASDKLGLDIHLCEKQADCKPGINITNYEKLHHFDPSYFGGIVLDECFTPDTLIDTLNGPRPISQLKAGDLIYNAAGIDFVSNVHRREVKYAVKIRFNGRAVISSPNHPYFTRRGWVGAQDLRPGDEIIRTSEAVRLVRQDISSTQNQNSVLQYQLRSTPTGQDARLRMVRGTISSELAKRKEAILQSILLSEMADVTTRISGEGAHPSSSRETGSKETSVVCIRQSESRKGEGENCRAQSAVRSGSQDENLPPIERDEAQTFRAWGQWQGAYNSTANIAGCSIRQLDGGVCFITGPTNARLSLSLQDRLSQSRLENRHRGGWQLSPLSESTRPEEGCQTGFVRVESLEILEPGHPELEKYRDAHGSLYFYDIGATRHPSFSVNGVLVHNSSILKAFDGKTRKALQEFAQSIKYRLCCTATPSPNDLIELTNHAEFLDVMSGKEVIALYFTQDGNTTHKWRLKGHARRDFWRWLASWAVALERPSDLGFDDASYDLPPLRHHQITVAIDKPSETLFPVDAKTLQERRQARKDSLSERVRVTADLINNSEDTWVVWCDLNSESTALKKAIPDAIEITGSDPIEKKHDALVGFSEGRHRVLITKPSIAGFGLNWQHCHKMAFVGLSDSFEQQYQAKRRCWRFGQQHSVDVYVIVSETEGAVVSNIQRKEKQMEEMMSNLIGEVKDFQIERQERNVMTYEEDVAKGDGWTLYLGDCIKQMHHIEDERIGFSIFSPPFPGLYVYSNSPLDVGNCDHIDEMIEHFRYLIKKDCLYRVMMPGRTVAIHLMQLTAMQSRDGYIGTKDYRGKVIEMMTEEGWHYAREVTIDKNPQIQATRNKERGLLFKSLATDSSVMWPALADYLLLFRKPGKNPHPIRAGISEKYDNPNGWVTEDEWVEWASPVWYRHIAPDGDTAKSQPFYPSLQAKALHYKQTKEGMTVLNGISETDVLNVEQARETDDERHLCPLQLCVIERGIKLWSAPGEIVLSPFAGVGSEGFKALELNRQFIGIELKRSYWESAIRNLKQALQLRKQQNLFSATM